MVSDFVFPSWFEDFRAEGSAQFDQGNHITKPLDLLRGGYIGAFEVTSGTGWHQLTAEKRPTGMTQRGNVGSRRERRRTPRYQWVTSALHKEILRNAEKYRRRIENIQSRRAAA